MKGFRKWIYKHIVWILIIISILIFLISKLDIFIDSANEVLENISYAVLSSGVFAAVLKSIQFTGIFKEEIEKIILGTDFIYHKSEESLDELWRVTSQALYKKKFPELNGLIEDRILKTYLPTTTKHYLKNYIVTI